VHAYDEAPGRLEVDMLAGEEDLTIVVRDHGAGIQPKPARTQPPALGLGLPLIAALSDAFELRGAAGHGTEVRMTFAYIREADPADTNPVTGTIGTDGRWNPAAEPPASTDDPLQP
jgi:serine/threonine-protein kinase RsbW